MQQLISLFKVLSDKSRVRILLLLARQELCVCQLMEILRLSQPLVSRNLNLLRQAGFIEGRRNGKLVFYRIKKNLPREHNIMLSLINESLSEKLEIKRDLKNLKKCEDFVSQSGDCDLDKFRKYMRNKKTVLKAVN